MATAKTTAIIELKDKLSPKLKEIQERFNQLKNKVSDSFKSIQKSSKETVDKMKKDWKGIALSIVGALYTIKQAFDLSEEAAKAQQSFQAFYALVKSQGKDVEKIFDDIKEKSAGLISNQAIVQATNMANSFGIPLQKIGDLMEIARYKARIMGTDVKSAFEDIVVGIGRTSPMILDNLGIMVKLGEAYDEYAKKIGVASNALTNQQQKLAILDYVLKNGKKSVDLFKDSEMTLAEKLQKTNAELENARYRIGIQLAPIMLELAKAFEVLLPYIDKFIYGWKMIIATFESAANKLGTIWDWITSGFKGGFDKLNSELDKQTDRWVKEINKLKDDLNTALKSGVNWKEIAKAFPAGVSMPTITTKIVPELDENKMKEQQQALQTFVDGWINATANKLDKQLYVWDKWYKNQVDLAKKAGLDVEQVELQLTEIVARKKQEIVDKYNQQQLKKEIDFQSKLASATLEGISKSLDINKQLGNLNKLDYYEKKIEVIKEKLEVLKYQMSVTTDPTQWQMLQNQVIDLTGTLEAMKIKMSEISGTVEQGLAAGIKKFANEAKTKFEDAKDLAYNTAKSMESAFSDMFFDAMQGKLKSLDEYFRSFAQSIMRYIADIMAKMVALQVLSPIMKSFNIPMPSLHTGGYIGATGIQKFHDGGIVGLNSDEVPAILQVGEAVLSKKAVQQLTNGSNKPSVVVNIENKASDSVQVDVTKISESAEKQIIDVVVKNIRTNPSFRQIVKG